MLKKTFFLFYSLLLFFVAISCSNKGCENMNKAIVWDTTMFHFRSMQLSVAGNYYRIDDGVLKVSPTRPIRTFYDVYRLPIYDNTPPPFESHIKVETSVLGECLNNNNDDMLNSSAEQIYKTHELWQPISTIVRRKSNINHMTMHDGKNFLCINNTYPANGFHVWRSNRGDLNHRLTLDIVSSAYKGEDGNLYNLLWCYSVNIKNACPDNPSGAYDGQMSLNMDATNSQHVVVDYLNISGAAINITLKNPFVHNVYIDGVKVEYNLENVQSVTTGKLALSVTR